MQFLNVFLQNSCKRRVFTKTTQVQSELSQTGSNQIGFIGFFFFWFSFSWNGWTATESPVFSGPVQPLSVFFPVLWTGLLIPSFFQFWLVFAGPVWFFIPKMGNQQLQLVQLVAWFDRLQLNRIGPSCLKKLVSTDLNTDLNNYIIHYLYYYNRYILGPNDVVLHYWAYSAHLPSAAIIPSLRVS